MKNKIDPESLGLDNICFSMLSKGDSREKEFKKQRIDRGFDESETWCLFVTIAKFIVPRLEEFIKIYDSHTLDGAIKKQFLKSTKDMLLAFTLIVKDKGSTNFTPKEIKLVNKGLKAFQKNFFGLWL
jgi:hypothetical protein